MLTVEQALIATLVCAAVTFFTRLIPFIFFSRTKPSIMIQYLQKYIPPMTMVILVIYSVKDIIWGVFPYGMPEIAGILVTFILHIWKNNPLFSIFGATAIYMIIIRMI